MLMERMIVDNTLYLYLTAQDVQEMLSEHSGVPAANITCKGGVTMKIDLVAKESK